MDGEGGVDHSQTGVTCDRASPPPPHQASPWFLPIPLPQLLIQALPDPSYLLRPVISKQQTDHMALMKITSEYGLPVGKVLSEHHTLPGLVSNYIWVLSMYPRDFDGN